MPLPSVPETYRLGETLKLYESSQIEFKENSISLDKLKRTVCAFLNTIGGYIFVGVDDWCKVVGVPQKTADLFVLLADQIIREQLLLRRSDSSPLTLEELNCKICELYDTDRVLLLIRVQPAGVDENYMFPTGEMYYRLNASNYCRRDQAIELLQLKEQMATLKLERGRLSSQLDTVMVALKKSMLTGQRLERERDEAIAALHARILAEKEVAERTFRVCRWFCGLF